MKSTKELLAYCGLYCGDCAGHSGEIAESAKKLKVVMSKYKFGQTAKHMFPEELKDYAKLNDMLNFIAGLRCPATCRERPDDTTKCEIRKCCRRKGYYACYECADSANCDKLDTMTELHGQSCIKNLRTINKTNIDEWIREGKRLWFADDELEVR